MATQKQTASIVDGFLAVLGRKGWKQTSMAEIARESGVRLSVLRRDFPQKLDCLAAYFERLDARLLDLSEADAADAADEPPRDRLAEQLMRRLDDMEPARDAMRELARATRADPFLALAVNRLAARSQRWVLAAAGIHLPGPAGNLVAQGLTLEFRHIINVWLDDNDPDRMRTMAELDKGLRRGEAGLMRLCAVKKRTAPLMSGIAALLCGRRSAANPG